MKILVLRHGETEWNTCARLQGQMDIDLNENGIQLAKTTRDGIRDLNIDVCFTSPLKRARHTAEILLEGRDIPIFEDERLMEISFGSFEGKKCKKGEQEVPEGFLDTFYDRPFDFKAPEGGETFAEVCERVAEFLKNLTANRILADQTVLLSCHGCCSRAILYMMEEEAARVPSNYWRGCVPPNLSISTVNYEDGRFMIEELDHIYYDKGEWKNSYER